MSGTFATVVTPVQLAPPTCEPGLPATSQPASDIQQPGGLTQLAGMIEAVRLDVQVVFSWSSFSILLCRASGAVNGP